MISFMPNMTPEQFLGGSDAWQPQALDYSVLSGLSALTSMTQQEAMFHQGMTYYDQAIAASARNRLSEADYLIAQGDAALATLTSGASDPVTAGLLSQLSAKRSQVMILNQKAQERTPEELEAYAEGEQGRLAAAHMPEPSNTWSDWGNRWWEESKKDAGWLVDSVSDAATGTSMAKFAVVGVGLFFGAQLLGAFRRG